MNATVTTAIAEVLHRVRSWPAPMRIALARQILETLEGPPGPARERTLPCGPSAVEVAALVKADKPAPDDTTVRQWTDEYRLEEYGK